MCTASASKCTSLPFRRKEEGQGQGQNFLFVHHARHQRIADDDSKTENKPNAVFAVEEDTGRTTTNAQCLHQVHLQSPRRTQITTQLHLSDQSKKVTACFVLNDYSDSETLANPTGQNVPSPTESTGQTLSTSTSRAALSAINIKMRSIVEDYAADKAERPRLGENDFEPGWNTRCKSATYRGKLYEVVLRDYPKQVVSSFLTESVPDDTREFLSLGHYRIR